MLYHVDDRACYLIILVLAANLINKGLIDLQALDGHIFKISEGRIACSEIVKCNGNTHICDLLDHLVVAVHEIDQTGLGKLYLYICGIDAEHVNSSCHLVQKVALFELNCGHVYGHDNVLVVLVHLLEISAGGLEYPCAYLNDSARFLSHLYKGKRRNEAQLLGFPADKHLKAVDIAVLNGNNGLEVKEHLVICQSAVELLCDSRLAEHLLVKGSVVISSSALALLLGTAHCDISVTQEHICVGIIIGINGDTY